MLIWLDSADPKMKIKKIEKTLLLQSHSYKKVMNSKYGKGHNEMERTTDTCNFFWQIFING